MDSEKELFYIILDSHLFLYNQEEKIIVKALFFKIENIDLFKVLRQINTKKFQYDNIIINKINERYLINSKNKTYILEDLIKNLFKYLKSISNRNIRKAILFITIYHMN